MLATVLLAGHIDNVALAPPPFFMPMARLPWLSFCLTNLRRSEILQASGFSVGGQGQGKNDSAMLISWLNLMFAAILLTGRMAIWFNSEERVGKDVLRNTTQCDMSQHMMRRVTQWETQQDAIQATDTSKIQRQNASLARKGTGSNI